MAQFDEALKEAMASLENGVILQTLELRHDDIGSQYYIVNQRDSIIAQLEDGNQAEFIPTTFRYTRPKKDDQGFPDLSISIDNVNQAPGNFVRSISKSQKPLFIVLREYLTTNLVSPSSQPLVLTVKDIKVTAFEVVARATFANIRNKAYPNQRYTRLRFPSLGN